MGIITDLIRRTPLFKQEVKKVNQQYQNNYNEILRMRLGSNAMSPPRDNTLDAFLGYSYACMAKIANDFSATENIITVRDEDISPSHWLIDLINNPHRSGLSTWNEIKELVSFWLDINGNAYLWTPTYGLKLPQQIWVLPSSAVSVVAGSERLIDAYTINLNGTVYGISPDEVCHVRTMLPSTDLRYNYYYGTPRILRAAQSAINADAEMMTYISKYFERDAVPPLIYETQEMLDDDRWALTRKMLTDSLPRNTIAAVLEGGASLRPLTTDNRPLSDVATGSAEESILKRICICFGVAPGLLTGEHQNKATAETVKSVYQENTIDPKVSLFEQSLQRHFNKWEQNLKISHSKYRYIDPNEERENLRFAMEHGIWTINDERRKRGLAEIPLGDTPFIPSGMSTIEQVVNRPVFEATLLTEETTTTDSAEPTATGSKLIDIFEEHQLVAENNDEFFKYMYWKKFDNINEYYSRGINQATVSTFKAMKAEVLAYLKDNVKSLAVHEKAGVGSEAIFDVEFWEKEIIKRTTKSRRSLSVETIKQALKTIGVKPGNVAEAYNSEILNAMKRSNGKIKESINTIHSELKEQISRLMQDNAEMPETELREILIEETSAKFDTVYTQSRANMIARTSATTTSGASQKGAFERHEVRFVWLSQRDDSVRETHWEADGTFPDENGMFSVGDDTMDAPGNGDLAEENCNCQCVLMPIKED